MKPRVVRFDEVAGRPWRNGGGITRELLTGPTQERWHWRVSVADIERDAPFSLWADVQRWFVPVEGGGVELRIDGLPRALELGDAPIGFDGAALTTCRLLAGPTRDLNLMLRGATGGLCRAFDGQGWAPGAAQCGLYTATAGTCSSDDESGGEALPAHALAWWPVAPRRLCFSAAVPSAASTPAVAGWWMFATPDPTRP